MNCHPLTVSHVPVRCYVSDAPTPPRSARVPRCEFGYLHDPLDWICPWHPKPQGTGGSLRANAHGRVYATHAIVSVLRDGSPVERNELHQRLAAIGLSLSKRKYGETLRELRVRGKITGDALISLAEWRPKSEHVGGAL